MPPKKYTTWLGFDSRRSFGFGGSPVLHDGRLPVGGVAEVLARPQLPVTVDRFCVWSRNASSFLILSLHVGQIAMGATPHPILAEPFATNLDLIPRLAAELQKGGFVLTVEKSAAEFVGRELLLPPLHPAVDVRLYIENIGEREERFLAVMFGYEPEYR